MAEVQHTPVTAPSKAKPLVAGLALLAVVGGIAYGVAPLVPGAPRPTVPTAEMDEAERGALRTGVLTLAEKPLHSDKWERTLQPFDSIEFKYTIEEGQPLLFKWWATGEVHYDLHSHPFEGGTEMTEGFSVGTGTQQQGVYIAPFSGIHGWFWQNRTMEPVTVTIEATGAMTSSTIYEGPAETTRAIEGVAVTTNEPTISHQVKD